MESPVPDHAEAEAPAHVTAIPRRFSVISLVPLPSGTAITDLNFEGAGRRLSTIPAAAHGGTGAHRLPQCIAVFVATIGSFGLGTVLGWTAPALDDLRRSASMERPLGTSESSWIASLTLLGALFSGLCSGIPINHLGRRRTMLLVAAPLFLAGWALIAFAPNYPTLYAGRFVTGYAGGTFPLAVPIYVGEVTEDRLRGLLGSAMILMLVNGMLFSFVVGSFVGWRTLSGICGIVPILLAIGLPFVPESPRYLMLKGDEVGAHKALLWLRRDEAAAEKEFEILRLSVAAEQRPTPAPSNGLTCGSTPPAATRRALLTAPVLKPALTCMSLMFFQQFGGINGIISYTVEIFRLVGPNLDANMASIILCALQVVVVVASMVLVDRVGRKVLLIGSEIIMCISLVALGSFFYVKDVVDPERLRTGVGGAPLAPELNWLPFISLVSYIVAYSGGMGPVPWLLTMELLNPVAKGTTTSMVTMSYWLLAFISTKTFEDLGHVTWIGWHGAYWGFAAVCLAGLAFITVAIPETKGRSSSEIQKYFDGSGTDCDSD